MIVFGGMGADMQSSEKNADITNKLAQAAQKASQIKITGRARPVSEIKRLHKELEQIRQTYKKLVYSREQITPAFEWLFDNYYIIEREGRQVIKELKKCCKLPLAGGVPSVRIHAGSLCEAASGAIDSEAIEEYIVQAQKYRDFETDELYALALMLRAALISGAAKACTEKMDDEKRKLLLSDAVKTLNFLTTFDFSRIVERQSRLEQILSQDPSGVYKKMDESSRALYRKRTALIAKKRNISETEAASAAIELAKKGKTPRERHVGYYILERDLDKPNNSGRGKLYFTLLWALPAVVSVLLAVILRVWWVSILLYLPLWEAIRPITDYFILKGIPATYLPRIDIDGVIPEESPTLVVVSTLLTSPQKAEEFSKKLEQFYYSNGRGNIMFGILADFKEAKLPEKPEDKAMRTAALKQINMLNRKYGGGFCLFVRSRRYCATQENFCGWERKRGAIVELVRMIKGQKTSITTFAGDYERLKKVKYIITLDADTGLVMDAAAEMVSAAMHPLNTPYVENEIVTQGYGILAPRICVDLESAAKTPFSRIMVGAGGLTAYDNAAGDIYQDIFHESVYAGKGIINVDAFYEVLDNAFPENRILSHDILEGCFMRAGYLSDVELTDGYPVRPVPWFERLHRWIRGDWQNKCYICSHLPDGHKSPFNALCRFRLIDNMRRSITPVFAFACIAVSAFMPIAAAIVLILAAYFSLAGSGIWSAVLAVIRGGPSMLSRRYHCRVLPQAVNLLAQGVLYYLFLPYNAYLAVDAVIRALWRSHTGKKLLEWVTAAESESQKGVRQNSFMSSVNHFWPTFVIGAVFLLFAPQNAAKLAGAFFLVTPFFAWLSGIPTPPIRDDLSDDDTDRLRSYTAAMWRYYEDYATKEDNYLPPDNFQEAPVTVLAHRTSPTNIGLMLLSTLAARDLQLIDSETMFDRIEKTVSTIEKLKKWKGHLYNWYDTQSLEPLKPEYISTVDSGNLVCCLVALREGLADYAGEYDDTKELCRRIKNIEDEMDLAVLFNKHRRLFHIGYDIAEEKLSDSYYDLFMSEARMTSYYAVAKRIVPKRHWGALGRTLTRFNGYTGPISWTGTMFEYMMPHLLLPVYEDSMAAEALRFVISCQMHRVKEHGIPWGISESGFYSFDAALNYQYEAHGVQKLALKRGMNNELVISPYSTFLALPFARTAGMKNLRRLEAMGIYGQYGFYEAADFSYKRTGGRMAVVKSYMAHHVGMSIVAADNALCDGIMQDRFMRNHEMRAARDLLCEKIPADAVVFNDVLLREVPEKPGRYEPVREEFDVQSPVTPRVNVVSNGEYTMVLTDCGASMSLFHGIDITRRSSDLLRDPSGIFAAALFGKTPVCVTEAPEYEKSRVTTRSVEFNTHGAVYHVLSTNFGIDMQVCLKSETACEVRAVELENYSANRVETKLLFYFEPSLAKAADAAAHPAFSRLFISVEYRPDTKILIFSRRPRGNELPACLAVGFAELDADFEFEGDRASVLTRPYGISSLLGALTKPFGNRTGALVDPAAAIRIKTVLAPHGKKMFTLLMAAANVPGEAAARLIEARWQGFHAILRGAAGKDSGVMESRLAALVLPKILFPVSEEVDLPDGSGENGVIRQSQAAAKNQLGQPGLWQLGISGDDPIVLFNYDTAGSLERLKPYIKMHRELRLKGIQFDLVITYKEGGDYARKKFSEINCCIRACGCEYLCGARGGVHIVNLAAHSEEIRILLLSTACHIALESPQKLPAVPYFPVKFEPPTVPETKKPSVETFGGGFENGSFVINHSEQVPEMPWCNVITTPTFGTLVSDRALGFTWALNSHENRLTPWSNDTSADNRGEILVVRVGSTIYDICLNAKVTYSPGHAVYESEAAGLKFRASVSIPGMFMAKLVSLEIENERGNEVKAEAAYYTEPILGSMSSVRHNSIITHDKQTALIRNPWAQVSGCAFLTALEGADGFITNRADFLSGKWNRKNEEYSKDPCAAVTVKLELPPKNRRKINFILGFAGSSDAAHKTVSLLKKSLPETPKREGRITVKTPDARLDEMVNTFLVNQIENSRLNGRTGFYQNGGAFGFRDQLQDCCAAVIFNPQIVKAHIYRSAAHQFKEGDVMHWWHQLPPRDGGTKGVRTRCSDDMLWLPFTVCEYLEKTGDYSIFDHDIYYLDGDELDVSEESRYFSPKRSDEKENVYLHCIRAINRGMTQGEHGITLFGSGDWNDGMNLVGIAGKGESVWLAMFLVLVLERFIPVARHMGDEENAQRFEKEADRLKKAIDEHCWNGEWYMRGFYDDGSPLGAKENVSCRIDLLPQSFATIANLPNKERRKIALDSMEKLLVDDRLHLVRLFDPAFDSGENNPGYIRSYPPGIRENGGQYTHSAIWAALALLIDGRTVQAYKILSWINPAQRTKNRESAQVYRLEPYAIAADIYTNPSHEGRGGWSFYTGAAGWYYKTVVEYLLGIKLAADKLFLNPNIPDEWPGFDAQVRAGGAVIKINVSRGADKGLFVDGKHAVYIPIDGKDHEVRLII